MHYKIIILVFFSSLFSFGQTENIATEITAENVFDLSIIKVLPESYPDISVIFQAKNDLGAPLWKLDASEISISENGVECEVLQLINISEEKPIKIGLVLDHSSSMNYMSPKRIRAYDSVTTGYQYNLTYESSTTSPLDYAKEGVKGFLDVAKNSNDSILLVGFSSTVDTVQPLTTDVSKVTSALEGIEANGATAFFDALYYAIEKLPRTATKSVIVALTDGQDNQSKKSIEDVIAFANKEEVSIYTIGLGMVDDALLNDLSRRTNGFYYPTNDPEKLKEVYQNIKAQIKSIYQVDYTSKIEEQIEDERSIQFSFVNDTLQFSNPSTLYTLPEEAISYIQQKEQERTAKQRNSIAAGAVSVLLLGLGSFLVYYRKKQELAIKKAYPNPFQDEVSISYNLPKTAKSTSLKIIDLQGNTVFEKAQISEQGKEKLSLANLSSGVYLVQLIQAGNASKTIKIIKK